MSAGEIPRPSPKTPSACCRSGCESVLHWCGCTPRPVELPCPLRVPALAWLYWMPVTRATGSVHRTSSTVQPVFSRVCTHTHSVIRNALFPVG